MADPGNISYGLITGRFVQVTGDSSDPDRMPDYSPIADGEILITPSAAVLLNVDAQPDPVTLIKRPVTCTTDSEGYLVDGQGSRGVYLVATDDEDVNPSGFTYRVDFRGPLASRPGFSFAVPGGSEQDLAALSPVPSSSGQAIVVGPEGPPGPAGPVDVPDTGAREISAEFTDAATATTAIIRRWGPVVVLNLTLELHTTTAGAELIQMPIGWRPQSTVFFTTDQLTRGNMNFAGRMRFWSNITGGSHNVTVQWFTGEAFPTTLPGTPL